MSISIATNLIPVRAMHRGYKVRTNNNFVALPKWILHLKVTFNMILQCNLERQRLCNNERQRERVGQFISPSTFCSVLKIRSHNGASALDFRVYGYDAILGVPWYHSRLIFF